MNPSPFIDSVRIPTDTEALIALCQQTVARGRDAAWRVRREMASLREEVSRFTAALTGSGPQGEQPHRPG